MNAESTATRDALALAAGLVGWSFVSPRLPPAWRVTLQAAVGALLTRATRAPLGLRPPRLWAGARLGSVAGVGVAGAIAATTALPAVRTAMAAREPPAAAPAWLLLRIPIGTVWAEEATFRAALAGAGARAFGRPGGRLLQAAAFGLSHIPDARATGQPVTATVLVTGIAGWAFGWLADRSGSLAAPMLAHLALNEAGAVAALTVRP
ncbi:CPBP family intramembrane metalloprotease [Mycobacterium paraense]|uniref:Rv0804 family intramembrane glutamic endopeptidase n=1 Tax=Mycobacterium paraense TaxID=767916 RepID=UPI000A166E83|nr:CPBP family intramembrane glutamic endopeptidase [Mycobacterium paraense]MCV7441594.1 CPBP family intramembrane metalloprotease [Mycobacterium paraense]ORW41470.1 abortive phage infection protein [Mycobacterium paraense]